LPDGLADLAGGKYAVRSCLELYRGNPTVDAKAGIFRGELCVPIRPV
jgi:hypothetical protein